MQATRPIDARRPETPATMPEAVAPPRGHPRFPLMDSLRALAALGVMMTHVTVFSGLVARHWWGAVPGNLSVGVAVFFVLSGFLLYRPFVNAQLAGAPRLPVREYLRRRVLRIVPAYWLALTVFAIYPGLPGVFTGDWWRYYGLMQIYDPYTAAGGIGIAWTLCVEASFYLVLPIFAAVLAWLTRRLDVAARVRVQLLTLGVVSIASIVLRVVDQRVVMQIGLLTHFYWFALGMGLAVLSVALHDRSRQPRWVGLVAARPAWCWAGAAVVYLVMCAILTSAPQHLFYSVFQSFWLYVLSGLVAVLMVVPAVFGAEAGGLPRRVLAWPVLAWLGLISYGLYLWHATIAITLVRHGVAQWWKLLALTLVLTVSCAAISYYVVERPILRLKHRRARRASAPADAVVVAGETSLRV
jgi:peptidoglycan/LPS O-acetylase OafA/YrhL